MALKDKNQRQIRKQILRHLENTFDLERLDYKKRVAPLRHRAILAGVLTAAIVYGLGFGLAYYAWKSGKADYETMAKFAWIFMIPSSVVGAFAYLLTSNRREFGVARDILEHIGQVEGADGMLWRYEPVLLDVQGEDDVVKRVIGASREGAALALEPEDYANIVHRLHAALESGAGRSISEEAAAAFEVNLAKGGT